MNNSFFSSTVRSWPAALAVLAVLAVLASTASALNYEVYPGSAFYLNQMVSRNSYPYVAQYANGFYYHPVGFGSGSSPVLTEVQKQSICDNFSNPFAMVEGDMSGSGANADINDINNISRYGLKPIAAFVNQPSNTPVWKQLVANNGALNTPSYEMLAPWVIGKKGWSSTDWDYARANMQVAGCAGSGIDSPVNLYRIGNGISAAAYQQAVWDQCKWTKTNGKKFNYLISPNEDIGQPFLDDTQYLVRSLEDHAAEPNVYGSVLYGLRNMALTPETITVNGVVQANWTITGVAYYLLKHRDGEAGTLDLYATANSVNYAQAVTSPILGNAAQTIPFTPAQSNTFTLTLANSSAWLDYAAVLRARTAQAANWNITFKIGTTDITSSVLNNSGYEFLSAKRLMPNTSQLVTVTVAPKILGSPTPLNLVVEALPHSGVDQALDVIAFQYQPTQSAPTLNLPTTAVTTRQALATAPIWFTVGDAETLSSQLTVTAVSGNTTLVPNANIVLGSSGVQRWINITPVSTKWGVAPITVTVSDGTASVSNMINLTVEQTTILPIVKANNTDNLEVSTSWAAAVAPDDVGQAVWNNTVTAANTTTLGTDANWGGIKITNPGGLVTINGSHTLGLDLAGVDMSAATQNLTLNCPLGLTAATTWNIAASRVVTVNGSIGGQGVLAKSGTGTLTLAGTNTYSGGTLINSAGGSTNSLLVSNSRALGTGAVTIGGLGNNDGSCLNLAGNITFTNSLASWASRNGAYPNLLNVSGTNTVTSDITAGSGGNQSSLKSDSGTLVMTGDITTCQLNLLGAGDGELAGIVGIGAYNLVKSGTGTWTLSGINTYTGATTITGGQLVGEVGGSCASSAVTVAATAGNTAALGVAVTNITKQWTCASLTVKNAGTSSGLDFDFGTRVPSTTLAPLKVTGAVTLTTAPTLTVELPNSGLGAVGTVYPLMNWSGSAITAPAVTVTGSRTTAHTTVTGTSANFTLNLVLDGSDEPLRWATSGAGTWDTGTANWKTNSGTAVSYSEAVVPGDTVRFDETYITANTAVTLNTNVTPTGVTASNSLYSYTISGTGSILGGAVNLLSKTGSASVTLNTGSAATPSQVGSVTATNGILNIGGYLNSAGGTNGFALKVFTGGTINQSATTVASNTYISIADGSAGTLNLTGGTTTATLVTSLFMGKGGATGTMSISNATFNLLAGAVYVAASYNGGQDTGANTTGILTIGNNGVFNTGTSAGNFIVGNGSVASIKGTINLNDGGTLATARSIVNGATSHAISTFNFNGGTLQATAANANFISNVIINVRDGGATIDTTGGSVTIAQPLVHSTLSGDAASDGGLTKTGANTLTLTGANNYSGGTTVSAGILSLTLNNTLSNNSAVRLAASAATLNLNFTGTDVVASLYIGGTQQASGIWGATGSGAAHTSDRITGSGLLSVTTGSGGFGSWATTNNVLGGANADSDHDGIPNLVEYALALNPAGSDGAAGTFVGKILTFRKRAEAVANGDVTYGIEKSTDLGISDPWTAVIPTTNTALEISYTIPAGPVKIFARLKINQLTP